jgi:hypothetical protein
MRAEKFSHIAMRDGRWDSLEFLKRDFQHGVHGGHSEQRDQRTESGDQGLNA